MSFRGSGAFVEEEVPHVRVLELDPIGEILGYEIRGRSVRRFCFGVGLPDAYRRDTSVVQQDQPVAHEAGLCPKDRKHPAPRDLRRLLSGALLQRVDRDPNVLFHVSSQLKLLEAGQLAR